MTVKMTRVWDATSEFLNERASSVFALAAGLVFAPTLLSGIIEQAMTPGTPGMAAAKLLGIVLSLTTAAGALAITALAIRPMRAGEAAAIGARRLLPFIGVSIVLVVAAVVATLPVFVILAASGFDFTSLSGDPTAMPDIAGGTALALFGYGLVMFGLILWVSARLAVLLPVVIAERRGFGAIARAWGLTRGHALKIIGVFILYIVVALILVGGVGAAAGAIGVLFGAGQPGLSVGALFVAAVTAVISTLLSVVQSAFTGKLYTALAPASDLEDIFA